MIFLKLAILGVCSAISGICFRLGGRSKDGSWYDAISHSKVRDIGCSLMTVGSALMFLISQGSGDITLVFAGTSALSFLLTWGALSSYGKFLNRMTGRHDKERIDWLQYTYSGIVCGLSMLPLAFCGISIWAIIGRTAALILFFNIWWKFIKPAWLSEGGRGFVLTLSTALFAIN